MKLLALALMSFSGTSPQVSFTVADGQIDKFRLRVGYVCRSLPADMRTFRAGGIVLKADGSFHLRVEQRGEFLVKLRGRVRGREAHGSFVGLRNTFECSNDGTGKVRWSASALD